jgi:hypothetical protein
MTDVIDWRRETSSSSEWWPRILSRQLVRYLLFHGQAKKVEDTSGRLGSLLEESELTSAVRSRLGTYFVLPTT